MVIYKDLNHVGTERRDTTYRIPALRGGILHVVSRCYVLNQLGNATSDPTVFKIPQVPSSGPRCAPTLQPVQGGVDHIFCCCYKKSLSLFHCVPLYVCRLCINFQDLCARLLGMAALHILLLTFTSRFVIDFLSIRKVIIFSAIATDDRHPLRSRSIHQNAANCMTIRFRYIAQPRGVRKTYCARSRK